MPEEISQVCQITSIQPGRRRGRFNIYVDNEFAVAVGEKVLIELGLKIGQTYTTDGLQLIALAAERERAMQIALRFLETRPRTKKEIEQRLYRSGIEGELTAIVVNKLLELELIDDADFAKCWVETRSRTRPKGIRSLRSELSVKGVAPEDIDTAVEQISPDNEVELAKAAIAKRIGVKKEIPTEKTERDELYKRMVSFLQRRGFSWSTIKTALGSELEMDGEED
jgi:regulatory protein